MTLDEMEKLARDILAVCEASGQNNRIAKALLAVMPVVRLAERYAGADLVGADVQAAIDQMRREMEEK